MNFYAYWIHLYMAWIAIFEVKGWVGWLVGFIVRIRCGIICHFAIIFIVFLWFILLLSTIKTITCQQGGLVCLHEAAMDILFIFKLYSNLQPHSFVICYLLILLHHIILPLHLLSTTFRLLILSHPNTLSFPQAYSTVIHPTHSPQSNQTIFYCHPILVAFPLIYNTPYSNMHNDNAIKKIQSKFQDLINLDQNKKSSQQQDASRNEMAFTSLFVGLKKQISKQQKSKNIEAQKKNEKEPDQLIFTKSDICRQVAKLKPYLRKFAQTHTSVQMQDRANKRITDQQQNSLSDLVIYLNRQLCQRLRGIEELQGQNMIRRNKQKQGWVYQVSYRYAPSQQAAQLSNKVFKNGYAVLTQVLQLYPNLTFGGSLLTININQLKRIKYTQQGQYQVIDIRFNDTTLHIGFLNDNQMRLFDRMLFLLKNMARTSSTRLFQNQLLKNIYSQY